MTALKQLRSPSAHSPVDALVEDLAQQFETESAALIAAAHGSARALVAHAHGEARARMHETIMALRRERSRRAREAEARRQATHRAREARRSEMALAEARPMLMQAITDRWRDADHRRKWIAAIGRFAAARLRHDVWRVKHPEDWKPEDGAALRAALAERVVCLSFEPDTALVAGLRIVTDGTRLDATPDGLTADGHLIAGLLLAAIAAGEAS